MAYRIMILVEDLAYIPCTDGGEAPEEYGANNPRATHPADAGWSAWTGMAGDMAPAVFNDYEHVMEVAERLTVVQP